MTLTQGVTHGDAGDVTCTGRSISPRSRAGCRTA